MATVLRRKIRNFATLIWHSGHDGADVTDFYKEMFAGCPAGRPGTADEVANVAELSIHSQGAFITWADILVDGGATASYLYGGD